MAELQSGQEALVERRLEAMREASATTMEAAGLYRTVGIPIVEALAAFHRGAYLEAVELLLPVRFDLWRIGGSHAQRDVIDWTLTEAAVRAGQRDVAVSLAHERLATRSPMRRQLSQQGMSLLAAAQCRRAVRPSPRRRSSTASVSVARRNAAIVRLTIPLKAVFV